MFSDESSISSGENTSIEQRRMISTEFTPEIIKEELQKSLIPITEEFMKEPPLEVIHEAIGRIKTTK